MSIEYYKSLSDTLILMPNLIPASQQPLAYSTIPCLFVAASPSCPSLRPSCLPSLNPLPSLTPLPTACTPLRWWNSQHLPYHIFLHAPTLGQCLLILPTRNQPPASKALMVLNYYNGTIVIFLIMAFVKELFRIGIMYSNKYQRTSAAAPNPVIREVIGARDFNYSIGRFVISGWGWWWLVAREKWFSHW